MAELRKMNPATLTDYLVREAAPAVFGPGSKLYIIDHHHHARAYLGVGVGVMVLRIQTDWSGLSPRDFWRRMFQRSWAYPYDSFGRGPLDPEMFPATVLGLVDDIYRSLAWAVEERGGFLETDVPFAEFHWAAYFRGKVRIGPSDQEFRRAVSEAMILSRSPEAASLPGYRGENTR